MKQEPVYEIDIGNCNHSCAAGTDRHSIARVTIVHRRQYCYLTLAAKLAWAWL